MSPQDRTKRLIFKHQRRLQILKEQQATFGIETPPHILIEIEEIETTIQRLQSESHAPFLAPSKPPDHVGRAEINHYKRILLSSSNLNSSRLVLQGMGGIGKTTLAIEIAHDEEIKEHFEDGILWANLGPDSTVENWLITWGDALGEDLRRYPSPATKATRLRDLLAHRTCLLVIDDVWSNVDLSDLLVGGSNCCTIITTREIPVAHRIGGNIFEVGVLDETNSLKLLSKLAGHDMSSDARAAQLVALIGHLPLAIRLIGPQLSTKNKFDDILNDFRSASFKITKFTDEPEALTKDHSLKLSFSLSLENLNSDDDRNRFIQLTAFAKNEPFDKVAAYAVWGDFSKDHSTFDYLDTLVRHALVMQLETSTNSVSQYLLHPVLHSFATEELLKKENWGKPYERHTKYYLRIAKNSIEKWQLAEEVFGQIKAAFDRVKGSPEPDYRVFEFIDDLSIFFEGRGLWSEYVEWAKAGLKLAKRLQDKETEARMLRHIGYGYYLLGKLDRALDCNKFSLQLCRLLDDQFGVLNSLKYLGHIYKDKKNYQVSEFCYKQSLIIARRLKNKFEIADCLGNLGHVYQILGDLQAGLSHCQQALAINQELDNKPGLAKEYNNVGLILYGQGHIDKALENYREALDLANKLGNIIGIAFALTNMGTIYFEQQRYTKAERFLSTSVNLFKELGNMPQVEEVQDLLNLVRLKAQL